MATAKQALAAARRKWGKRAFVRENKHAFTPSMREERQSHVKAIMLRVAELDTAIKAAKHDWTALLKAAEFCRDVNAQEPSLSQLGEQATKAREYVDMTDERSGLRYEAERLRGGLHTYRWEAGYGGVFVSIHAQADTLDELIRKIEPMRDEQLV